MCVYELEPCSVEVVCDGCSNPDAAGVYVLAPWSECEDDYFDQDPQDGCWTRGGDWRIRGYRPVKTEV